jgi:hypothetical protein
MEGKVFTIPRIDIGKTHSGSLEGIHMIMCGTGMILRMENYFKMYKPWQISLILHMSTINVWQYFRKKYSNF